jgi:hypothetical protein
LRRPAARIWRERVVHLSCIWHTACRWTVTAVDAFTGPLLECSIMVKSKPELCGSRKEQFETGHEFYVSHTRPVLKNRFRARVV